MANRMLVIGTGATPEQRREFRRRARRAETEPMEMTSYPGMPWGFSFYAVMDDEKARILSMTNTWRLSHAERAQAEQLMDGVSFLPAKVNEHTWMDTHARWTASGAYRWLLNEVNELRQEARRTGSTAEFVQRWEEPHKSWIQVVGDEYRRLSNDPDMGTLWTPEDLQRLIVKPLRAAFKRWGVRLDVEMAPEVVPDHTAVISVDMEG